MSKHSKDNRLPIEAWETESLRLTAFPVPASPLEDAGWWQSLVGQPPEVEILHPREGGRRAEGAFATGRLILETSPVRIDLHLMSSPEQITTTAGFLTIGKFTEKLEPFVQVVNRWLKLDSCPEIKRIAFGAVLLASMDSKASGYRQLAVYLPSVKIDPGHSSDFFYQINRPRDSITGVANLTVNRLTKWSVATISGGGFVLEPTRISIHEMSQKYFACRLELDINTATERQEPLPRETVPSIFAELVDLAKGIVMEGDTP